MWLGRCVYPWGLDRRQPPTFEPIAARLERGPVLPPLLDCWTETLAFAFTVANGAAETHSVRQLFGPFRVDQLYLAQSGTDGLNVHNYLTDDDSDADPTTTLTSAARVPRASTSDLAAGTEGVSSSNRPVMILPGYISRRGTAKLAIFTSNASAAPVDVWGAITITHLYELVRSAYPS